MTADADGDEQCTECAMMLHGHDLQRLPLPVTGLGPELA
jgi:hypothetical protein